MKRFFITSILSCCQSAEDSEHVIQDKAKNMLAEPGADFEEEQRIVIEVDSQVIKTPEKIEVKYKYLEPKSPESAPLKSKRPKKKSNLQDIKSNSERYVLDNAKKVSEPSTAKPMKDMKLLVPIRGILKKSKSGI
jgi:hypothetical protein